VSTFELKAEKLGFLQNPDSSSSLIYMLYINWVIYIVINIYINDCSDD
jgi:hypothetical protein